MENEVKEPAPKYNYMSPEVYLEIERAATEKHEYHKGEIYAMAGASMAHCDIASNLSTLIGPFLRNKGCKIYGSDFRVYIPLEEVFTYPDLSIVCGKSETEYTDNLTNPIVIIEILSPSTKDYDRGTKFGFYRRIKTLKEYILIDSTAVGVEIYTRENNGWVLKDLRTRYDLLHISTIDLEILLKDIYVDVDLPE